MGRHDQVATVFGATGFIGRHLVRRLVRAGYTVRVPSRRPGQALFLKTSGAVGQVVPMVCNIRDEVSVGYAVRGATLVINLIGILAPSGSDTFQQIHAEVPGRIARTAKAAGVRQFVQMSALGASATSPSTYARSKAEGEAAVRAAFPEAVLFRPSVIFGPEDSFLNRFASMARILPFLPLIGGGLTRFQPVYVGDVADAVMAALARPEAAGQTYELVGPRIYRFRELMELVKRETARPDKRLQNIPFGLARLQAFFLERLPGRLLTRDQVELLKVDNVGGGTLPGLADLGISPTALEIVAPTYLDTYRVGGRFSQALPVQRQAIRH
jgi:uncharacterized protein YbjT (DUF2867 family)